MADSLDPKTAGPTITVEVDFRPGIGRPDFLVPLKAERRFGGYRAIAWRVVGHTVDGLDLYEVEMSEIPGAPKEFVGDYDA